MGSSVSRGAGFRFLDFFDVAFALELDGACFRFFLFSEELCAEADSL